jgi:RES domain-containing protein
VTETVTVWRLNARRFAKTAFSGDGAFRLGGRWNHPGTRVVYCAESRALAALEALVHVEDVGDLGAVEWRATPVVVPFSAIERPARYPHSWRDYPCSRPTRDLGSAWARDGRSVALRVPSAVVPGEFNYLLNAAHPGFAKLKVGRPEAFRFDARLARREPQPTSQGNRPCPSWPPSGA